MRICIERDCYDYFKVFSFQGWMDNCLEDGQSRISGSSETVLELDECTKSSSFYYGRVDGYIAAL